MKLFGWINVTFQPHLYVLSLTIGLAVYCSADGNGTEFSNKTLLHINSSSLHHRTTNEPSSSTATLSHLNMNKSRDDEKIHNFKGENQVSGGVWTVNYTITTNDPTTSPVPSTRSPSVHNQSTAVVMTTDWPIEGNFSTNAYWLSQGNSTHAENLNVTNKREIGINPELKSAGYPEIQMIAEQSDKRNDSSKITLSHDWNSNSTEGLGLRTTMSDWNDPSSRRSNSPTPPAKVWGFPFHNSNNHSGGTFNSSTSSRTTTASLSSLWRNTSSSRPSAKKFLTGTPHQFSSKSERGEPWNKSETHGQNHFNSIVNVRVDSGAETLEKMIRLEALIKRKMDEMERTAKAMAADLKSRLNRLEATLLNSVESRRRATTDVEEMKQHLESLINVKSQKLEKELIKFKCAHHQDASATQHAQTTNEPITSEIVRLRDSLKTHQPPMENPESKSLDREENLAEWRAKRTKLMEKWESNFQRGLSSQRKSTTKRSTRNLS